MGRCIRLCTFVFVGVLVGGCGDGDSVRASRAIAPNSDAAKAAAAFISSANYPQWAAAGDQIVGYSGTDTDNPESATRYGVLGIGQTDISSLPAPPSTRVVEPLAISGIGNQVILIAGECDRPPSNDIPVCAPGDLTVFSLDLSKDAPWTRRPLPPSLQSFQAKSVALVQPTKDSIAFVALSTRSTEAIVFEVSESSVRDSEIPASEASQYCQTDKGLFSLTASPTEGVTEPSDLRLTLTGKRGAPEEVGLPPVNRAYGGTSVRIVCDEQSVYVTSSTPDREPDARVWILGDTGWQLRPDLVPERASLPARALSSFDGLAIAWTTTGGSGALVTAATGDQGKVTNTSVQALSWKAPEAGLLLISSADDTSTSEDSIEEVWL